MGHGIEATDRTFSVREMPWMGLLNGQVTVFDSYKTREELQPLVHGWEPVVEPVYRKVPYIDPDGTMGERFEPIVEYKLGARSDNGDVLAVNSKDYEFVKNAVIWDLAEAVEGLDKGSIRYETGGSLRGGKSVWLLLAMNEPLIIKGDRSQTIPYLCFQNAHDGRGSFRAQATNVRVVCANTSIAADLDAKGRGTDYIFHHTKNVGERIEEAKQALAGWRASIETFREQMEMLAMSKVTPAQVEWFLERVIPMPNSGMVTKRVAENVTEARGLLYATLNGPTNEGLENTALGLYNAAVEHHDWTMGSKSEEARFTRNFIRSNKGGIKAHAFKYAMAASTAV